MGRGNAMKTFMGIKTLGLMAVAVLLLTGMALVPTGETEEAKQTRREEEGYLRRKQIAAMKMWEALCDTKAGVRIYRTADEVEGILLMKVRPDRTNYSDQYAMDDPYGKDSSGDMYIKNFLQGFYHRGQKTIALDVPRRGFQYVETYEVEDGRRYRYTASMQEVEHKSQTIGSEKTFKTQEFVLIKKIATGKSPRYGVTYDDISTREQRYHWIAGSSLKVIDLEANELMAERVGYMVDQAQGNQSGGRSPWLLAANNACPSFVQNSESIRAPGFVGQRGQTIDFVDLVLKATKNLVP